MKPIITTVGTGVLTALATALPATAAAASVALPQNWYAPAPPTERPAADTMTAQSYHLVIDARHSRYTYRPKWELVPTPIGEEPPGPPTPIEAGVSGYFDLEVRSYTWVDDSDGHPLTDPVTDNWLFLTAIQIELSNSQLALTLPSTNFQLSPAGGFSWSLWNCPQYPHAPWAPGYYESCTIYSTYGESLAGAASAAGFTLDGSRWNGIFGPSWSYEIVVPAPATVTLLCAGALLLRRRTGARSRPAP